MIPAFDERLIPAGDEKEKGLQELRAKIDELAAQTEALQQERLRTAELASSNELLKLQLELEKERLSLRKNERLQDKDLNKSIPELIPESVTRKIYIDTLLAEAGWEVLRMGRELNMR